MFVFVCVCRREVYNQGIKVCILEPGYFKTDLINANTLMNNFRKIYDATPDEVRRHYGNFTMETCKCH